MVLLVVRDEYARMLDSMPDAIVVVDGDGRIVVFNAQAETLFGYSRGDAIGQPVEMLLPERFRGMHPRHRERYGASPTFRPMGAGRELIARRADGREFPAEISLGAFETETGTLVTAAVRDASERRQIEATLRQSEELFRSVAATAPVGIFRTDTYGRCTYVNQRWLAITGLSLAAAMGDAWLAVVHPDEREKIMVDWWAATGGSGEYSGQFRIQTPDGRIRWVSANAAALRVAGGIVGFVGSISDITPQVEAEAALATARDDALEASRMKSEFLANMSHEIRTPMNGVLGMAEMLLDTDLSGTQRRYAAALRTAGTNLLQIINDILDFSKIEAGKLRLEAVDFDLRADVEEVASLLLSTATDKGVALGLTIDPAVPWYVRSDPVRISQVLTNLVANAVKFTEEGSVDIVVSARDGGDGTHHVRFEVRDTGIGIPAAAREKLLDPFSQADASTTRRYGGTGLGLAICRQLVELLGGTLGFVSEEGQGSTFWFELPLEARPVPDRDEHTTQPERRAPAVVVDTADDGHRALLVEDNPINQLVAKAMLEKAGYSVDIANDGAEAVAAVGRSSFDVILMDCQMPVMDGFEATKRIRTMPEPTGRLPIIAMTAAAMAGDRERCLAAGMDDYVAKPVTGDALGAALERARHRRAATPGLPAMTAVLEAAAPPAVDHDAIVTAARVLREQVGDDAYAEALGLFLSSGPDRLAGLGSRLERGELDGAGQAAHSLKGSAATFGAARVAEIAHRIELACRAGDGAGAREWLQLLHADFVATRVILEGTLPDNSGTT